MSDQPIIMSAPHVLALLAGTKTQHRVMLKPQPPSRAQFPHSDFGMERAVADDVKMYSQNDYDRLPKHPTKWELVGSVGVARDAGFPTVYDARFAAGMKLWVRETYGLVAPDWCDDGRVYDGDNWEYGRPIRPDECTVEYRADLSPRCTDSPGRWPRDEVGGPKWRSATQMPRWASRLTLDVSDVRVQRLQEIGEENAVAEGVRQMEDSGVFVGREGPRNRVTPWPTAREAFADIWDSLHAKPGERWDDNPWICALSFAVRLGNIDAQEMT